MFVVLGIGRVLGAAFVALVLAVPVAAKEHQKSHIAFGLNGVSDWSSQHPFLDIIKTARPWFGHTPGQWGAISAEQLREFGAIGSDGMPLKIPPAVEAVETLILTDQPVGARHLSGRYHVLYDGEGKLTVTGRGRVVRRELGKQVFEYRPGGGFVGIRLTEINRGNPIRNIRVVKEDHLKAWEAGQIFNPHWLRIVETAKTIRFMDWGATNDSPIIRLEQYPKTSDFSYALRGVPVEIMIRLANEINANPWMTIPHAADNALVRHLAETVKAQLAPHLVAHIEFSNEVWNFIFEQSHWSMAKSEALWGEVGDGWVQYYGLRAAQVMDIWADVFGTSADARLKRIIGVQSGWQGLERPMLKGALATRELGKEPATSFDAYAVTGYFAGELSGDAILRPILDAAERNAQLAGQAKGLARVALREYVKQHRFDDAFSKAADIAANGSVRNLIDTMWPYHAEIADAFGLELVMYEGGTHATPLWEEVENERLVAFLTEFNYSAEMGALYGEVMDAWRAISDAPFNAFVDVAYPSKWGSWGALRHLDDDNPRWQAIQNMSKHSAN